MSLSDQPLLNYSFPDSIYEYLLAQGVDRVDDLKYLYEDGNLLEELKSITKPVPYRKFLNAKAKTTRLKPEIEIDKSVSRSDTSPPKTASEVKSEESSPTGMPFPATVIPTSDHHATPSIPLILASAPALAPPISRANPSSWTCVICAKVNSNSVVVCADCFEVKRSKEEKRRLSESEFDLYFNK
jgi:hypothetical protein